MTLQQWLDEHSDPKFKERKRARVIVKYRSAR